MKSINIRKASIADVNAIAAVIAPFIDDVICSEEGRERFQPQMLKTIFERTDIHYFGTEIEAQVVGCVAYIEPSHVMHYFLLPEYHGQGYGRHMWDFLEAEILQHTPDVMTVNSSFYALEIYKKFGFEVVGEVTQQWGVHFIPMRKTLHIEA
jgi:ribosomal protein S18 acetylase RimI-like enzyme